ncbi:signal peptidase I [Desulfococcaceae bacterium HSG8]|nr:signal peptidase I [Desulfococcaceae bacterium HSG8]
MKEKWKKKISMFWRGWGYSLLIAIVVAMTFRSAIAELNLVPTGSMKPTIVEGDRIFVNKLAYDLKFPFTTYHLAMWGHPMRGDIVVFFSPADEKRLVKRVVGLPGDAIFMRNNRLFINEKPAEYGRLNQDVVDEIPDNQQDNYRFFNEDLYGKKHPIMVSPWRPSVRSFGPMKVPEGHYFMMGDNRDNSSDSRFFGFVRREQIVGRASGIAFSFNPERYYLPRWHRFFSKLL